MPRSPGIGAIQKSFQYTLCSPIQFEAGGSAYCRGQFCAGWAQGRFRVLAPLEAGYVKDLDKQGRDDGRHSISPGLPGSAEERAEALKAQ